MKKITILFLLCNVGFVYTMKKESMQGLQNFKATEETKTPIKPLSDSNSPLERVKKDLSKERLALDPIVKK